MSPYLVTENATVCRLFIYLFIYFPALKSFMRQLLWIQSRERFVIVILEMGARLNVIPHTQKTKTKMQTYAIKISDNK